MLKKILLILTALSLLVGCSPTQEDDTITVRLYGWGGDENVNAWLDGYVKDTLKSEYNINLVRVGMNIDEILSTLSNERIAGKEDGDIDLVWINGANFSVAKELELLKQIDTTQISNYNNISDESQYLYYDFGTEIDNYEIPFGKAQFVFVGEEDSSGNLPTSSSKLLDYVKANPGTFTYPSPPDFTGNAFVRNIAYDIVGYEKIESASEDVEELREVLMPAFDYLNEIEPYLWEEGKTYPREESSIQQMYSDGILDYTMSYTALLGLRNIEDGNFSTDSKTFVFENGNIANAHYLAIPFNSQNDEYTYQVLDFLLSAEAQSSKLDPSNWGDLPVITYDTLSDEDQEVISSVYSNLETQIDIEGILENSKPELSAQKTLIIEQLWEEEVLNK